ncbi:MULTISPECIES: protein tyrosine phosphatase [Methylobacterium]|uniref:Protein tyrosine phosphatase n=1 Tax=Methylobacterium jeotgali TaxID=381630 RepID=A0ABQ4SUI4_9HYPH|nr:MULTISPECIES: protein tyrosine phosphatase [Methylobacterium]PIU07783.1 MAG: protein tyrosine phosphatase [Methylobacterium sp. CG09_land_8_20_14_0_10_71_15]PIU11289.1 MAG: protein tyrosine phosphatase [Methylobacterium sp. CG08_land_8_20_14_0_20_71_15]GBU20011.1 protein-tyrosine-phosphatase [Methylobacterium sp.]GJE06762.1 hypothetical protein AOPFMNJM_2084 [Methylobacterium jeotgali]
MPRIHVCPLSRLPEALAASGAGDLLSLIGAGVELERPEGIAPERHRIVRVNDLTAALDGHVLPAEEHVAAILAFARGWDRERPLLMHCYAGISRSTAAAYIAACALMPERDEDELAQALRAASPSATPNALLVAIADGMLGREGRMSAAIAAIGRGAEAFEGEHFHLSVT